MNIKIVISKIIKCLVSLLLLLLSLLLLHISYTFSSSSYLNNDQENTSFFENELKRLKPRMHNNVAYEMQSHFPEGFIFTNVLYGLSCAELIRKTNNVQLKESLIKEIKWSLNEINSNFALSTFDSTLTPTHGAFYTSWKTFLQGKYLSLLKNENTDTLILSDFHFNCQQIKKYYLINDNPFPQTYQGVAWPGDVVVGIAALKISDKHFGTNYHPFIQEWVSSIKNKLSAKSPLIPHSIQFANPNIIEASRGSSQVLTLRFLYELDKIFADEQYQIFRKKFVKPFLGYKMIKESLTNKTGIIDIDSGPVIFGFGSASNIVGIAPAKVFGDKELFSDLNTVIEVIKSPAMKLSDNLIVADLFILWSRISEPIEESNKSLSSKDVNSPSNKYFIITLIFIPLAIIINIILWRRKK